MFSMGEAPWPEDRFSEMRKIYVSHQLSPADLGQIGVKFCDCFCRERERLSVVRQQDLDFLDRVADFLLIPRPSLMKYLPRLQRVKMLTDIRAGHLPEINAHDIALARTEKVHWQEMVSLMEERVVSRRYVGGSRGVSVHVAKGVTLRAGAYRGHSESIRKLTVVSAGTFSITNRRLILAGGLKAFSLNLDNVIGANQVGSNRILITPKNVAPKLIELRNAANRDVVHTILGVVLGRQQ